MIKIYDDKLAEEICARMDEEIRALDAHIAELLNYGKLPEIVDSMQARREAAERVKRNICRVNEEAHRIDAEAAAELRKETEKLRAFSRKLDDINAMLVSVMKPEAMNLSNDSGVGFGGADKLTALMKALSEYQQYEQVFSEEYIEEYLTGIGIEKDSTLYNACKTELKEISIPMCIIRSQGMHAYRSGNYNKELVVQYAVYRVYIYGAQNVCAELDTVFAENDALKKVLSDIQEREGIVVRQTQLDAWSWAGGRIDAGELNRVMKKYHITNPISFVMFMATCKAESNGADLENGKTEKGYYDTKSYTEKDRGVGYLQLTGREAQQEFLNYMGDGKNQDVDRIAEHIKKHYNMWEVAAYTWSVKKYGDNVIPNDNIIRRSDEGTPPYELFLSQQYFINGYPQEYLDGRKTEHFGARMTSLLDKSSGKESCVTEYQIIKSDSKAGRDGRLVIEGVENGIPFMEEYRLPNGWKNREEAYNEAMGIFMEE